jgi:N-acetylmuramoyl-L-alanine amidase
MKKLKHLIIHCTATPEGREVSGDTIKSWHMDPPPNGRGWNRPGYSDIIHLDGWVENLQPFNQDDTKDQWEITYGVAGQNHHAHHVVYVGGCDQNLSPKDTRTASQLYALELYVKMMLLRHPGLIIAGHNQFANKACPSFDVPEWLRMIDVQDHNIYQP